MWWPKKINILQITDCHLLTSPQDRLIGVDTADSLCHVLDAALAEGVPDVLLASGDIAHDPTPVAYSRFLDIVQARFSGPIVGVPGNHDVSGAMPPALNATTPTSMGGWHLVPMDTHVDDQPGGSLSDVALARLRDQVAALDGWICLVGHHPPVEVGAPWLDKDRLDNYRAVLDWVAQTPRVKVWLFGHVHQAVDQRVAGCHLLGCPSTCFQFAERSERFAIGEQSPGYRWLNLNADGSYETRLQRVDDYSIEVDLSRAPV